MDEIGTYLRQIGRYPQLAPEVQQDLANKLPEQDARNALINSNLRLVVHFVARYNCKGIPQMELIQLGNMGLVKATDRYDPTKGMKFSTYAVYWIKEAVQREFRRLRLQVPVVPLETEREDETGSYIRCVEAVAPEADLESRHLTLELMKEIDRKVEDLVARGRLRPHEIEVFKARVYMEKTLKEIALELEVTAEAVRQIQVKVCNLLNSQDLKDRLDPN